MKNNGEVSEISAFTGVSTEEIQVQQIAKIKQAFPSLDITFFQVLLGRVRDLGISDERLKASVNNVIDNCQYPTPTIAQFISFDKSIEILDYNQWVKKNDELHGKISMFYKSIKLPGVDKPYWAKITDIQKYNLELFTPKTQTK